MEIKDRNCIILKNHNKFKQYRASISFESKEEMDKIKSFIKKRHKNFSKWVRKTALAEIEGKIETNSEINLECIAYQYTDKMENKIIEKLEEDKRELKEIIRQLTFKTELMQDQFLKIMRLIDQAITVKNMGKIDSKEIIKNIFKRE
ncbi:MAG: hypothetical protein ACTSRG_23555 [Candidatus Helarchaeota archaeon]